MALEGAWKGERLQKIAGEVFEKLFTKKKVLARYHVGGICVVYVAMPFQIAFKRVETAIVFNDF